MKQSYTYRRYLITHSSVCVWKRLKNFYDRSACRWKVYGNIKYEFPLKWFETYFYNFQKKKLFVKLLEYFTTAKCIRDRILPMEIILANVIVYFNIFCPASFHYNIYIYNCLKNDECLISMFKNLTGTTQKKKKKCS